MSRSENQNSRSREPSSIRRSIWIALPVLTLLVPLGLMVALQGTTTEPRDGVPPQNPVVPPNSGPATAIAQTLNVTVPPPEMSASGKAVLMKDRLQVLPVDEAERDLFHSLDYDIVDGRKVIRVRLTADGDELTLDADTGRLLSIDVASPTTHDLDFNPNRS